MNGHTPSPLSHPRVQEYQPVWERLAEMVERQIAAGERSLSRVTSKVYGEWRGTGIEPMNGVAFGEPVRMPRSALLGARQSLITQTILQVCRPDTAAIIELGSGSGLNLCDLYCRGGPSAARYFGLELTESGRRCLERLCSLEPDFDCTSRFFDFRKPDFGFLTNVRGHAVVFSIHAIEQIPEIQPDFFRALIAAADDISCVHLEPVGWQIDGRENGPYNNIQYAKSCGYNEDVIRTLQLLEDEDRITIDGIVPDIFSQKRKNASTLIQWSSRAPSRNQELRAP